MRMTMTQMIDRNKGGKEEQKNRDISIQINRMKTIPLATSYVLLVIIKQLQQIKQ